MKKPEKRKEDCEVISITPFIKRRRKKERKKVLKALREMNN